MDLIDSLALLNKINHKAKFFSKGKKNARIYENSF